MDLPNGLPVVHPVNHAPVGTPVLTPLAAPAQNPDSFAAVNVVPEARRDITVFNHFHQVVHDMWKTRFEQQLLRIRVQMDADRRRDQNAHAAAERELQTQVQRLQNQIKQQDNDHRESERTTAADVEQLRKQLADFGARNMALDTEKIWLEHRIEELDGEKVDAEEKFGALQGQHYSLRTAKLGIDDELEEIKDDLTAAKKGKHEADEQNRALTAELATERSGSSDLQTKLDAAIEAEKLAKGKYDATRVELAAEKTASSNLRETEEATMKEKNSHIEDLLQEIKGLKNDTRKIPLLTVNNSTLNKKAAKLEASECALAKKVAELKDANKLLQQCNDRIDLELVASKVNVNALTAKLNESNSKLKTAEQRSVKDQEMTATLTRDLAACRQSAERSHDELRACKKQHLEERSKVKAFEQEVERLKSEVSARTLERPDSSRRMTD
ncbi:hypothetical protein LTR37_019869 [Vermiconidia calcicola]|uniref:Uncharacterized protein n=1 Tax=Vermiconidia calcicola TaxID=1690605 RepID=A0ACC3MCY3_9PEZI|nr:hypothetical protein LTR37_019869 [Vermiconidia calcicola]